MDFPDLVHAARAGNAMKWILWLTFLLTIPVPYFLVEIGWVPTVRLILLAGMTLAAAVAEPDLASILIAGLFLLHLVVFAAVTYVLATLAARRIVALDSASLRRTVLTVVVTTLLTASLFPIFTTPLSKEREQSNLLDVLD